MTTPETTRINKIITDGFDEVISNDNYGYYLFWDIYLLTEKITKELNRSYKSKNVTKSEIEEIKAFFNAHMDEVIDIHIKE